MITIRTRKTATTFAVIAAVTAMFVAHANAASSKLLFTGEFGSEVNGTTKGDLCIEKSGDECVNGVVSEAAGGMDFGVSVAADLRTGRVYVADDDNNRIDEFSESGEFLLMFGWDVNRTKVEENAPQSQRDVCTAAEVQTGDECQAGEEGTGLAGQLSNVQDVAVDPETGDIYALELFNKRVEEFTASGSFVLMFGGEVNKTKTDGSGSEAERNICTAASGDTCQAGEFASSGPAHGAFRAFQAQSFGNLLTVGPEHLLYVTDEGRVQKFGVNGEWKGEIALTAVSSTANPDALAVDAAGDIFFTAEVTVGSGVQLGGIHELDGKGVPVQGFAQSNAGVTEGVVKALTFDPETEHLAAIEVENGLTVKGAIYDSGGARLSTFAPPNGFGFAKGLGFNSKHDVYVADADSGHQDIEMFAPIPVPVPVTEACAKISASGFTMTGEVNPENGPENVGEANAWFEYGQDNILTARTVTSKLQTGDTAIPVEAMLTGLLPDELYYYRMMAEGETDHGQPEETTTVSCLTLSIPPRIVGEPEAAYVTYSSATMFGSLNPENADTQYFFEYAPCENVAEEEVCATDVNTAILSSTAYGAIGAAQSVSDLEPDTTYRFRLAAISHSKDLKETHRVVGSEGEFTTLNSPAPVARTDGPSQIGATIATLNGEVNADGASATYVFEVGIYNGPNTVYSTVVQGAAGSLAEFVPETFMLQNLQPGIEYAYRTMVTSAYGTSFGDPVLFTTAGLSSGIQSPGLVAILRVPNTEFPRVSKATTRAQRLKRALKACRKERKKKRIRCEAKAHKRYPATVGKKK